VVLQRDLDRAIAPHREPADGPARTLGADGEGALDQADDVLDQVVLVGVPLDGVGVPASAAVGHHDHQRQPGDIALDARPAHPDRVVVGEPVEQVIDAPGSGDLGLVGEDHEERRRFP
jgi:hypothetical protein